MQNREEQQRFAQSASALGAGILGFGIGAKWGNIASDYVIFIILVGASSACRWYVFNLDEKYSKLK